METKVTITYDGEGFFSMDAPGEDPNKQYPSVGKLITKAKKILLDAKRSTNVSAT